MEDQLIPNDETLRVRMCRAACTNDESKLLPYQNRETLIKILEETGYPIPKKISFMSILRVFFLGGDYLMTVAPIITGALSYYYGKTGKEVSGFISMFSTVVILPVRKLFSEAVLWAEDKHRDYLLQLMDYFIAKTYGNSGTREMLIDLLLDKVKQQGYVFNSRKVFPGPGQNEDSPL
jgi:hypothetical protein